MSGPPGVDLAALEAEVDGRAQAMSVVEPSQRPEPFLGAADDPLERARQIAASPGVEYGIGWRTPILGQAWAKVRETIHGEARLYVDALMARQAELDDALLAAVDSLKAEVADLRRRLDELG